MLGLSIFTQFWVETHIFLECGMSGFILYVYICQHIYTPSVFSMYFIG